jgi:hypothetical protein
VAVGTLSLEDTYRPQKHRFLLLSKNLSNVSSSMKDGETPSISGSDSSLLDHREKGTTALRTDPFASISVMQIFDPLSPFKRAMNREVNNALKKKKEGGDREVGGKGDQNILRELDESLIIKTIGLSINVDASSVRQVLDIVGPAFVCIFSSPVQTLDLILSPLEDPLPSTDYTVILMEFECSGVQVSPRGKLIGCLENRRDRLLDGDSSGRDQNGVQTETGTGTGRIVVRALLKLDLRVESVTVDMMKASALSIPLYFSSLPFLRSVSFHSVFIPFFYLGPPHAPTVNLIPHSLPSYSSPPSATPLASPHPTLLPHYYHPLTPFPRTPLSSHTNIILSLLFPTPRTPSQALETDGLPPDLESVCCLELHGGAFQAMILDNRIAQAHVSLSQAELTDMRSISMGWVYRTLLSTDTSSCSTHRGFDTLSSSSLDRSRKFLDVNICSSMEDIIEVDVTVHYALAVVAVDTVRDISDVAMIIAYELLTTVRTAQNHVEDAADRFTAAVKATGSTRINRKKSQKTARIGIMSDLVEVSEDSESSCDTTTPATPVREKAPMSPIKSMNLNVTLSKAHVAVLEDPRRESSSALLLTAGADAQLSLDHWGGEDEESQEALHTSLRDVQVHVLSDTGAWIAGRSEECVTDPLSSSASLYASRSTSFEWTIGSERDSMPQVCNPVCEPFSLDIHFTRRAVKGVALASNIAFNMGDVSATVSLPYLSLARSIMLRGTLSGLSPPRSGDLDYYCVFGDRRGDRGTQVDVYVIALNIGKVSVAAVNDVFFTRHVTGTTAHTAHESAPLVRLQLLSLHLNADGVINPKVYVNSKDIRCTVDVLNIEGSGKLAVGADFYNPTACHWEPLVEEWGVALSVTKVEQGISWTTARHYK